MTYSNSNSSQFDYGENLVLIQVFTNTFSILGSSFIVLMYIFNKDLQSFAYKLVLMLSISDIIYGVGRMFTFEMYIKNHTIPDHGAECYIQSFLVTYGGLSTVIATMAISWSLTQSVVYGVQNLNEYSKWYYLCIFFIPLLISIIPAATGDYGQSGVSCWIADHGEYSIRTLLWRLFMFYIPLWISVIYNFINYYRISNFVGTIFADNSETSKQHRKMIQKLTYYPLIMVVCYLFATINRIYTFFEEHEIVTIAYIHVTLAGLQGFFNSLVYGFNKQVKNKLFGKCLGIPKQQNKKTKELGESTIKDCQNNSRDPSSRASSSSFSSGLTGEDNDEFSVQKELREKLGHDIYMQYDSHPGNQIFAVKGNTRISSSSEMAYVNSDQNNNNNKQDDLVEINLK